MSWDKDRSLQRIRRFKANVPETDIKVEDFAFDYLPRRAELARSQFLAEASTAIVNIPRNRAILTDGAHVYADLMDFGEQLTSESETQASYRRALQFLHLHYGACDRLIEVFGLQRVDFHGSRLHAVVLTPTGEENELERIGRALAFARAFAVMVERTSGRFGGRFRTRVSIGIDVGKAIAINSGRGSEHEPLFIGRPANHAAHLAACGEAGIHLSARVEGRIAQLGAPQPFQSPIDELVRRGGAALALDGRRSLAEASTQEIAAYDAELQGVERAGSLPGFTFHQHTPPLRTIVFADTPPSNAILMPMSCLFADLDGFTDYVDHGLATGAARQVVANLHVMRGEMAATVRDDFGGRKVRFIGDCIQAVLAVGDPNRIDPQASVEQAVLAAGGIRSSFDLCRQELPGIETLGLAIGIDYGITPACRLGLRGDAGVRCVTSGATCEAEAAQQQCSGLQTALGDGGLAAASLRVRQAFGHSQVIPNLTYQAAVALLRGLPSVQVNSTTAPPVRAHAR